MAQLRRRGFGLQLPRIHLSRRRGFTVHRGRAALFVAIALAVVIAFFCVLERRAAPQIRALAETAAKQQASEAISSAVEQVLADEQVTYERLVGVSDEGGLRSIQTDAREINLLRTKINQAAERALKRRRGKLRLPLGALLGSELLAGWGPNIIVPLSMTGDALSDIRSDISGAGVNQTMHRILMDLHVTLAVILPGGAEYTEVDLTVCLAETVIVGNVPGGLGLITQK